MVKEKAPMSLENILKATPEILAEYLNFLINFSTKPIETVRPYAGKGSIDSKLIAFLLAGVGFSLVISLIVNRKGPVNLFRQDSNIPLVLLPIIVLAIIFMVAIIFHVGTRIWTFLDRHSVLGGRVQDSINASFAFAAFFIPVTTIIWSIARLLSIDSDVIFTSLGCLFFIYFVCALSGTHPNTSFWQAFIAFVGSYVLTLPIILSALKDYPWPHSEMNTFMAWLIPFSVLMTMILIMELMERLEAYSKNLFAPWFIRLSGLALIVMVIWILFKLLQPSKPSSMLFFSSLATNVILIVAVQVMFLSVKAILWSTKEMLRGIKRMLR